jgi:hypothetical protein
MTALPLVALALDLPFPPTASEFPAFVNVREPLDQVLDRD